LESAANDVCVDDYAAQQKKLEGVVAPIVAKLYGQQGQQGQQGPNIEEVD
jgi:hypothetical protein